MLPAVASSFLFFLVAQCGWATKLSAGWDVDHTPVSEPLFGPNDLTLSAWAADVLFLTNPFRFGDVSFPKYNYPLWTMPVEYTGSMIIFLVVIGTSLARPVLRLAALAALLVYCMWMARWEWCLFISGVLIADVYDETSLEPAPIPMLPLSSRIDEEVEENAWRTSYVEGWAGYFKSYTKKLPKISSYIPDCFLFVLALYLGSAPTGNPAELAVAPGYGWLSPLIPRSWVMYMGYFYPDIGAILLVSVLAQSKFLQRFFTTRIAQYLGDISLSLYMLHVLVLHTLGNWLIIQCSARLRPFGSWGFTIGISSKFIHYDPKAN
jgi:peptidoglycan/LPS O-acetylase OafA/YrhL